MSTGRVVAGLVVFLALLGVGLYVKLDMEHREQPPHFRRMVEEMRMARGQTPDLPGLPTPPPRELAEMGRAMERLFAEALGEPERRARTGSEPPSGPGTVPEAIAGLGSIGDGPAPAPTFEDPLPIRPKVGGPARVAFGTHDGTYLVLSDGSAWHVAADHREIAAGWTGDQEVVPGVESLENRASTERVTARRLLAEGGRSVRNVRADGRTLVLDDGSVWYVGAEDRVEFAFWTPPTEVVVLPDVLLSPLRGRAVGARRVR